MLNYSIEINSINGVINWSINTRAPSVKENDADTNYLISVINELQNSLKKLQRLYPEKTSETE
ncbi:MAG: hypothetical protein IJ859_00625 [Synergistaceae bacterium]|nr:hypothetical protein [Synergistaceae bacterium]